jgi:hypothetical protein
MHQQLSSMLSAGGTPGKLAQYTKILADQNVNIRAIGGSEWNGNGAVAVLVDDNVDQQALIDTLEGEGFPSVPIFAAEAVLPDEVGALADAASRIGDDLNILTVLVADTHMGHGLVSFGFATEAEAETARDRLGDLGRRSHSLTAAWQAHEDWDRTNPNPAPTP